MATRKSISKKRRFELFKRDGFKCAYCGRGPQQVLLVLDHILPISAGGPDIDSNLVTACEDCNQGKSNRPLTSLPAQLDLEKRATELKERAEQIRAMVAASQDVEAAKGELEQALFDAWDEIVGSWYDKKQLALIGRLMPYEQVIEAMRITARKRGRGGVDSYFRYFCGITWNWRQHGYGNFRPQEKEQGGA